MPINLKRYYGQGHLHFITCSCYRRLALLGNLRARNRFVKILGQVRRAYGFALVGYVVMPEHFHLLIGEPKKGTPSTVLQVLKQRVSRQMRQRGRKSMSVLQLHCKFGGEERLLPQFWHPSVVRAGRRFHDFNVWSSRKRREKLEYMHANPVKRGLVKDPRHWPWRSCAAYAGKGTQPLPVDFLGLVKN